MIFTEKMRDHKHKYDIKMLFLCFAPYAILFLPNYKYINRRSGILWLALNNLWWKPMRWGERSGTEFTDVYFLVY